MFAKAKSIDKNIGRHTYHAQSFVFVCLCAPQFIRKGGRGCGSLLRLDTRVGDICAEGEAHTKGRW